ncbi:MAG: SAM-dependent methyltransferase [Ruminococcus sp.]|nr:SAM-dependent methyltransferase [Ruminococcus sp.]
MELSKRMQAVADLVTVGNKVADIGTDHAYIPIYLIEENISPAVIAMDINEGPLEIAENHIKENQLQEKIQLRLSNGFEKLKPYEAETAVIAGMGGALVIRILDTYRDVTDSMKEIILQPQSEIAKVRKYLLEEGFSILEEDMVVEDGKYYPMMKVCISSDKKSLCELWNEAELEYGKLLLEKHHPVLLQFLNRELLIKKQIQEKLNFQEGERIQKRLKEVEDEIRTIQKGLEYYAL